MPNGGGGGDAVDDDDEEEAAVEAAVESSDAQSPKRIVLSHTRELYNLESEWSKDKPKSEPQWERDNVRISV